MTEESEPRKILFLDFDGVLNSTRHFLVNDPEHYTQNRMAQFDLYNIRNLEWALSILDDVKIVIESTWGTMHKLEQMKTFLKDAGMKQEYLDRIIDVTPRKMSSTKNEEINWWLEDNPDVVDWAIVDDWEIYDLREPEKMRREVKTDPNFGFTHMDAIVLIKKFRPRWMPSKIKW
jgi:hypothetical protein